MVYSAPKKMVQRLQPRFTITTQCLRVRMVLKTVDPIGIHRRTQDLQGGEQGVVTDRDEGLTGAMAQVQNCSLHGPLIS
jgi:hypothetical protein